MTTNDVISTIENATTSLFQVLRQQEDNINRLEATVKRLEDRIEHLEIQLDSARAWGADVSVQRDAAKNEITRLNEHLGALNVEHDSVLQRLSNVIRSIHETIDPIVNPPYAPKPGDQPRDETGRFRPWADLTPVEQASTTRERHEASIELGQMLDEHERLHSEAAQSFQSEAVALEPRQVDKPHEEPEYPRAVGDYHF